MARTSKSKKFEKYDNSFYLLANSIAAVLAENKKDGTTQKEQVLELLEAERMFRDEINKYKYSTQVWKRFIQKIRVQDRNILYAKVYFREGSETFSEKITPAIKSEDTESLKKFKINFKLIQFIRDSWRGPLGPKAEKLYNRVVRARRILQECNLPLAINEAKKFYRKVPKCSITLLDMINCAAMGLNTAIDKYTGDRNGNPYSEVFRSVILGMVTGNLIKLYSERPMHFYPSDRRILYKALSIRGRQGIDDVTELAAAVNQSFADDSKNGVNVPKEQVTASQLQELLNASSLVSVEVTYNEENFSAYDYTPDDRDNPEEHFINIEVTGNIGKFIKELPLLHRKVLRLKGVNF